MYSAAIFFFILFSLNLIFNLLSFINKESMFIIILIIFVVLNLFHFFQNRNPIFKSHHMIVAYDSHKITKSELLMDIPYVKIFFVIFLLECIFKIF
ncbi:hypothetical protein RhiirC2_538537 [Rhizophagus irregularis]|uniref:Uncharacterized protein n=1 Tax=Rhizophagus irregularis TaxID=588596 RepID=A0A2N1NWY0_9GLOM|nr:hypothetical protein RhiirC2_538537 [Rhizophagus irregularis]